VYTNKVDVWGLGCILYELAFGTKAFREDWNVRNYQSDPTELELSPIYFSNWVSWLFEGLKVTSLTLLAVDWDKRPAPKEIHAILLDRLTLSVEENYHRRLDIGGLIGTTYFSPTAK
jgi:serine/threonine protein kinase